jgi:intein-encoded DNA endonuclease-like protein
MAKPYSEEILKLIIKEYNNGKPLTHIAKEYHKDINTLRKYLIASGIEIRKSIDYRNRMALAEATRYSDEKINLLISKYTSGKSIYSICKEYHADPETVKKYLMQNNIPIRSTRKHFLNENFFEKITTESQAYWLGFIYADGSVAKTDKRTLSNANRLSLNLSIKDKSVIYKFVKDINAPTSRIKEYTPKGTYSANPMIRIDINSSKICVDLEKYGVFRNKTLNLAFPNNLPKHLIRHFIRGYFDGDGCVVPISKSFSLTSNKNFLLDIQQILMRECQLNKTRLKEYPHKASDVYDLCYGGRHQVTRIYHYLYDNSTIFLERKKQKFELAISN